MDDSRLEGFAKRLVGPSPLVKCPYCGREIRPGAPKTYNPSGAGCARCKTRLPPLDDPDELNRLAKLRSEAEARVARPGCNGACGEKRAERKPGCFFCKPSTAPDRHWCAIGKSAIDLSRCGLAVCQAWLPITPRGERVAFAGFSFPCPRCGSPVLALKDTEQSPPAQPSEQT